MTDRPKRVIADDKKYVHFITFSCYRRRRLLEIDHTRRIVLGVLNHQLRALNTKCVGFVSMPDHIHALIWLPEPGQLRRLMHGWKRMSSFNIRKWFKENPVAYFELPAAHAAYYFDSLNLGDKFSKEER